MEESEKQARSIEGARDASNEVNSVGGKVDHKEGSSTSPVNCFCCGKVGHKASDHRCPARGKQCRKCNWTGHFEAVCKTKRKLNSGRLRGAGGMRRAGNRRWSGGHHDIRQVEDADQQSNGCACAFDISYDSNVSIDDSNVSIDENRRFACNNDY